MLPDKEVLSVLKKYSSETHPLTKKDIQYLCFKDYPRDPDRFTDSKIRRTIDKLINDDPKHEQIRYQTSYREDGSEYRTGFYYQPLLSKAEIRFLIDSILYSKVFTTDQATDLTDRLQTLCSRDDETIVRYADKEVFGKNRLSADVDVMDNITRISQAIKDNQLISFLFHNYRLKDGKIQLIPKQKDYLIRPVNLFLDQGRYFLKGCYPGNSKEYTFSVDLMKDIKEQARDSAEKNEQSIRNGEWALYPLQHPFTMGGETSVYTIRMNPDYISRLVDTFSYNIQSATEDPDGMIRVKVKSSEEGLKRWLMFNYESAELVNDGSIQASRLLQELEKAVRSLADRYVSTEKEG